MQHGKQRGFAYLSVLIIVAVMSIMTFKLSEDVSVRLARGKEADLLFNGDQVARAIRGYYENGPVRGCYPPNLEVLLEDRRDFHVLRHLRKIFPDPMHAPVSLSDGSLDAQPVNDGGWHLIKEESGRIVGVSSESLATPFKQIKFANGRKEFEGKSQYADWKFIAKGSAVKPASPGACGQ